ncbi:MAG: restriction endonuclease subunit S [Pseudomonadota bacterium]|nr:restriction endonuclease subunit S [Pseudomonadota bacterium]MEC7246316.1 restriction endonuclease subunit S [Pseudomonadota bacterium]
MNALSLKTLCYMQTGLPIARRDFDESGTMKVIQLNDLDSDGRLKPHLETVSLKRNVQQDKLIKNNDVLLKGRGTNMTATLIENAPENTIATAAFFILRPKSHILPGFLAWYLNNNRLPVNQFATIPLLQLSNLKEMLVHLPEREVQQQIIDTYKLIEEAQALSDRYYAKINQLLKGVALSVQPSKEESL